MPALMPRKEAAAYLTELGLPTAPSTLAKLFCIGGGPKCRHAGKRPLYEQASLIEWFESNAHPSINEAGKRKSLSPLTDPQQRETAALIRTTAREVSTLIGGRAPLQ